ncbi:MAG TPA: hypothetical protein PKN33_20845 [Phycisphaerae bacterium]|nr:hypothetical protein [Phycisphaerae bacterium]
MIGDVYTIPIKGAHHQYPHPHVVVIEISGSKESICVPAFSIEGAEVNLYLANIESLGISKDIACVELDNSKVVNFTAKGYTGKRAYWLVERFLKIDKSILRESTLIGDMKPEGIAAIAKGLLALNEVRPESFSKAILKRLRKAAKIEAE